MEQRKRGRPDDYFKDWKQREALAEGMIPLVGKLYRENNVKTYIYGQNLVNQSVLDIMKAHRFVRQVEQNELSEFETFPVIRALAALDIGTAHIDAGRIAVMYEDVHRNKDLHVVQNKYDDHPWVKHCLEKIALNARFLDERVGDSNEKRRSKHGYETHAVNHV